MIGSKTVILAGHEFEILPLDLGQVTRIVPLLASGGTRIPSNLVEMDALRTIVQVAVEAARPDLVAAEFQKIRGVQLAELMEARNTIGVMIGYFEPKGAGDKKPGEALAEESA